MDCAQLTCHNRNFLFLWRLVPTPYVICNQSAIFFMTLPPPLGDYVVSIPKSFVLFEVFFGLPLCLRNNQLLYQKNNIKVNKIYWKQFCNAKLKIYYHRSDYNGIKSNCRLHIIRPPQESLEIQWIFENIFSNLKSL